MLVLISERFFVLSDVIAGDTKNIEIILVIHPFRMGYTYICWRKD